MGKRIDYTKDKSQVGWIPICIIEFSPDYKRIIGLSDNGIWVIAVDEPIYKLDLIKNRADCYFMITILTKGRNEVEQLLQEGIRTSGLNPNIFKSFPFKELIKHSLLNGSAYWSSKGIDWLNQDDFDDEFVQIAQYIIEEKLLNQKYRHTLFRLMKRYERGR